MIAHIHGILVSALPSHVIIEAGGVGYKIFITAFTFGKLPPLNHPCKLHTVQIIREQSHALYGFFHATACELFEMLLGVTGIGPKLALCILGHMSEAEFFQAIANNDVNALSKIPGIGKKTAQRLLIEIRDKIPSQEVSLAYSSMHPAISGNDSAPWKLAMNALINLGYTPAIAQKAVQKTLQNQELTTASDLPTLIAESLKNTQS